MIVAVNGEFTARCAAGQKTAVAFAQMTVPETGVAPETTVKVDGVSEPQSMGSSNVTLALVFVGTPVAPSIGIVDSTFGASPVPPPWPVPVEPVPLPVFPLPVCPAAAPPAPPDELSLLEESQAATSEAIAMK